MSRPEATPTTADTPHAPRALSGALVFLALVVAAVGSLGAPLITRVAATYDVSLAAAQWTLTITLLTGAVATPVAGRLGSGSRRRPTTLVILAVVTAGSVCTIVPGSFALLVVGRAAQGVGLSLTALLMATAREGFDRSRANHVIAMVSVASTIGIGVGYPLAGLLTDLSGVRGAYAAGLVTTAAALLVGLRTLPPARDGAPGSSLDWRGAVLLGTALVALLIPLGDRGLWARHADLATLLVVLGLLALLVWVRVERHASSPLVDLHALRQPPVARAHLAMFVGGSAMYLLLTLATRYLQTPSAVGYGFGLDTFQAGLALVPFSAAGFAAGRLVPRLSAHLPATRLVAAGNALVAVGFAVFALGRSTAAGPIVALLVLGLGVGAVSAAMPSMILAATPSRETASAMSVNQVVRSVGFSLGSALGGLVLSARVLPDGFPQQGGYTLASAIGGLLAVGAAVLVLTGVRRHTRPMS
jgi:predicted MFS family arabinose efflux permease